MSSCWVAVAGFWWVLVVVVVVVDDVVDVVVVVDDVVDVVVVVVVVVDDVVVVVARARARAPNEPLKPDSKGARARGAEQQQTTGKNGSPETAKTMVFTMFFAASETAKIEDKDSETTKTLYFTMFLACGAKTCVQKSA